MKISYIVATDEVRSDRVMGMKGDYESLFAVMNKCGYDGVELLVRNPFAINFNAVEKLARNYKLDIPAICTGAMYNEDRLSLCDHDPKIRAEAIRRMKELMKVADALNACVNVGRFRGMLGEGEGRKDSISYLEDGLYEVASAYPKVNILLEPVNRQRANFIVTTAEALRFTAQINIPNVRIMLDYYQMVEERENVEDMVWAAKGRYDHVHVSDTDRKPPGLGNLSFAPFIDVLAASGYDGYVSVEAYPTGNNEADLQTSFATLSCLLR